MLYFVAYNDHTVVVFYFITVSFFLHVPSLCTGKGIRVSAQNGYVITKKNGKIVRSASLGRKICPIGESLKENSPNGIIDTYNITHNHLSHFNLHGTTVAAANMVFWLAVTLLAFRTSCSEKGAERAG